MPKLAANIHQEKLSSLKQKVTDWQKYFSDNIQRYHDFFRWIYSSSNREQDKQYLARYQLPELQCNVIEAYVNRAMGDFIESEPSPIVKPIYGNIPPPIIDLYEGHLRAIDHEAKIKGKKKQVYREVLSGGYSVMKVCYDYENERSFNQQIYLDNVYNPTFCGFDPLAQEITKSDGKYCYELIPMSEDDIKMEYPNVDIDKVKYANRKNDFNWYYMTNDMKKVVVLCEFYEKKFETIKIHLLADGQTITEKDYKSLLEQWTDIAQPPIIISSRTESIPYICRYCLIGDYVLEYKETIYQSFPLVFFDGCSVMLQQSNTTRMAQMTRPFVYNAIDSQRLKNFVISAYVNSMANTYDAKFYADERSIPEQEKENWVQPKNAAVLLYKGYDPTTQQPIPPPQPLQQPPAPQEYIQTFNNVDMTIQNMMGTFNNGMDINNNKLSGKAMYIGATQAQSSTSPYISNFLNCYSQVLQVCSEIIPEVLKGKGQQIPVIDANGKANKIEINTNPYNQTKVGEGAKLQVFVEAGSNFKLQQSQTLELLAQLTQAFPGLAQFINSQGIPVILKNLDLNGIEELRQNYMQFQQQQAQMAQQQQQAAMQQNPAMINAQVQSQKAQMEYQIEQQKLEQQKAELQLKQEELMVEKLKAIIGASEVQARSDVELTKVQTDRINKAATLAMQRMHADRDHDFRVKQHEDNKKQQQTGVSDNG